MPKRRLRLLLFLSSYAPLFLIFGIKFEGVDQVLFWVSTALLILGLLGVALLLLIVRRNEPEQVTIGQVEPIDADLASYIVTYLLPFFSLQTGGWRDEVALGILFVVLAIVYVNSRMIYVNPLLSICGFRLLKVKETTDSEISSADAMRTSFLATRNVSLCPMQRIEIRRVTPEALLCLHPED